MIPMLPPLAGLLCSALPSSAPEPTPVRALANFIGGQEPATATREITPIDPVDEGAFGPSDRQFIVSFQGSFTYANNSNVDRNQFSLSTGIGYFHSREHEFGANVFVQYQKVALDAGGGGTAQTYALLPYYNYNHYVSPRLALYGGPHFEIFSFDDGSVSETDFGYGFQVGARYWVSPSVSFSVEPRFTHRNLSSDAGDSENELLVLFGLNFVL